MSASRIGVASERPSHCTCSAEKGSTVRNLVRICGVFATAAALCILGTSAAFAGGNGAVTFTQHDRNVVDVSADSNPCTGDTGTLTMTYNDIFHGTINKTGSCFTGTLEGTIEFVPDNPAAVTYSGHFAAWFGDENNLRNDVEHSTFNAHLTGTDGTTVGVHDNAQAAMNANGVITVSFDHSTITCS
jgi:hypothetical protein